MVSGKQGLFPATALHTARPRANRLVARFGTGGRGTNAVTEKQIKIATTAALYFYA